MTAIRPLTHDEMDALMRQGTVYGAPPAPSYNANGDEVDPSCGCPIEDARRRRAKEAARSGYAPSGMPAPGAATFVPSGVPGTLTDGAPEANQPAGSFAFRTLVQFLGAEPRVNASAFVSALAQVLTNADIVAENGGVSLRVVGASVGVSARTTLMVTQAMVLDYPGLDSADAGGGAVQPGTNLPTWWVTITGTVSSTAPWHVPVFNRALARALWRIGVMSWGETYGSFAQIVPVDGGALLAMLNAPNACNGARNYGAVVAAACTRLVSAASAPAGECSVTTASEFWLRPTPTFDRVGPHYNAGTVVTVIGPTGLVSADGHLALYHVRVDGREGFVALAGREIEQCPAMVNGRPLIGTRDSAVFDPDDRANPRNVYPNFAEMSTSRGYTVAEMNALVRSPMAQGSPVEPFWLRASPTFAHDGSTPHYGATAGVYMLGRTALTLGPRRLYFVGVPADASNSRFGYAAFTEADVAHIIGARTPLTLVFGEG